jgi:hypothetical protein
MATAKVRNDPDIAATVEDDDDEGQAPVRPSRPKAKPKARIRVHNPDDYTGNANKTLMSFEGDNAELLARNYIKQHHPRGREVFLHLPNGSKEHYSADLDTQGEDPWTEYSEDEDA